MGSVKKTFSNFSRYPLVYWLLLGIVTIIFLAIAFSSAHQLPSRVDEGSFLIKGYYYITGKYTPFQDYGPWTNNMPLAYYIPGLAQALFGPGLKTGRYFMIFLTSLNLVGLWILINRLKGKWWALLGVLVLAINPAVVRIYVQALSQGIVACFLTWSLVFLIGEKRRPWQVAVGALLCALTTLTRQNMVFLLPFAVVYAFWLHGKKAGWLALTFTAIPFILVHLIFYPQILNLWLPWLPGFIGSILNKTVVAGGGQQTWSPDAGLLPRITSFFMAFRYHFVMLFGVFLSIIMLPVKKWWEDDHERKTTFLLIILFTIFFGLHAWASLFKDYCVFCFPSYIAFFLPIGLLVSVLAFSNLVKKQPHISGLLVVLFILIIIPGLFIGSLETVGRWIMVLPFPRLKGGQLLAGSVPLWTIFGNRFGLEFEQLLTLIPPAFGLLAAVAFALITAAFHRLSKLKSRFGFGVILAVSLIVTGIVFTPTVLLGNDSIENACGGDFLAAFETAGEQLADVIPDGAYVYWGGESVSTPLLYITGAELHPPQFNGIYSARKGGDRDLLEKGGYYNEASRQAWRESDEFFLIKYSSMGDFWKKYLNAQDFDEYKATTPLDPCDPNSSIRIYRRK
jgi:hypothetical protein